MLAAIGLGVAGFIVGGRTGGVLLLGGFLIGSVAGLEVALREHLGGYRSHTVLLASSAAVAVMAALVVAGAGRELLVPVAIAVFVAAFAGLRALFKRRSGGVGVKVR